MSKKGVFVFFLSIILLESMSPLMLHGEKGFINQKKKTGVSKIASRRISNFFLRNEEKEHYDLTYSWNSCEGKEYSVSFKVLKKSIQEAEKEFGYSSEQLKEYVEKLESIMDEDMQDYIAEIAYKMISESIYSQYIFVHRKKPRGIDLKLNVPLSLSPKVITEYNRIKNILLEEKQAFEKNVEKVLRAKARKFIEQKGFEHIGKKIGINYRVCIENNRIRLQSAANAINKKYSSLSFCRFLEMLVSFTQNIRYRLPPMEEDGKYIQEFWVPPKVIAYNYGDCDSKAVMFASLWRNFKKYPLAVIKVPRHSLIALAVPIPGGEKIKIKGIEFSLLEVCVEEQTPPGTISPYSLSYLKKGRYQYHLIH